MSDVASQLSDREMAELCALADGSLPDERRAAVEAWIAADPALRELLDRQRRAVAATQALADDPTPASLQAAVEARRPSRQARSRRLVPRLALVGAVALVVAVVAALLTGGPGAPTVAEAARLTEQAPSAPAPPPGDESGTQLAEDVDGVVFPEPARVARMAGRRAAP